MSPASETTKESAPSFVASAPPVPPAARPNSGQRRRALGRWVKRGVLVLIALTIVAGLIVAWRPRPISVDSSLVTSGPMRITVDEDGRARVQNRYVVSAPIAGNLGRIELQPGDDVKAGQALARVLPLLPPLLDVRTRSSSEARLAGAVAAQQQARLQVERGQVGDEMARADVDRLQQLFDKGASTRQVLDDALMQARRVRAELGSLRFAARVADHEVHMARASLSRLRPGSKGDGEFVVPSPISGRVLKIHRESEGAVQVGQALIEVGDPDELEIVVDVLTSDAVRVQRGQKVLLHRWGGPMLDGHVRRVEPSAFSRISALGVEEQRVNVVIEIVSPRERWAKLGDGYRIDAQIIVWEEPRVTQLPASAIFRQGDGWAVYREEAGVARLTTVKLGERNAQAVQIQDGIAIGARVLVHPSDRISDGTKVELR